MEKHQASNTPPDVREREAELKASFPRRLHSLREAAGQTQHEVAKALGFASESVYQLWEKEGGNLPNAINVRKLALHFGVTSDYLLGLAETKQPLPPVRTAPEPEAVETVQSTLLQLALQGNDWYNSEVTSLLLPHLRDSGAGKESLKECYQRLITDATYHLPPEALPALETFSTPATLEIKAQIERLFRERRNSRARQVTLYILDFQRLPSERLQRILLGMQAAELLKQMRRDFKQRNKGFTLAVSDGRMARNVLTAPNLKRGAVEDVTVMPLTLGRSLYDEAAATTLIGNFLFEHGDYGIRIEDNFRDPKKIEAHTKSIDLAFMGIGTVEKEPQKSRFARLLVEVGNSPDELYEQGIIGNILYQFVLKRPPKGPWKDFTLETYLLPVGKRISVPIEEQAEDHILRAVRLETLQWLVEQRGATIAVLANEPTRAPIIRAALEMGCANTLICTLAVAEEIKQTFL